MGHVVHEVDKDLDTKVCFKNLKETVDLGDQCIDETIILKHI
jgi:hypothetical protein